MKRYTLFIDIINTDLEVVTSKKRKIDNNTFEKIMSYDSSYESKKCGDSKLSSQLDKQKVLVEYQDCYKKPY